MKCENFLLYQKSFLNCLKNKELHHKYYDLACSKVYTSNLHLYSLKTYENIEFFYAVVQAHYCYHRDQKFKKVITPYVESYSYKKVLYDCPEKVSIEELEESIDRFYFEVNDKFSIKPTDFFPGDIMEKIINIYQIYIDYLMTEYLFIEKKNYYYALVWEYWD